MGVDFHIENEPRLMVSGMIKDWRGKRVLDAEEMEHYQVAALFEDSPELADLHISTIQLEPALPPEVAALHVGMPYSAFNRLRTKLAAAIGLDLELMWGFRPSAIRIGEMRGLPQMAAAAAPDFTVWEQEQDAWWDDRARQWDTVDNGMVPFLHHSDCEGDLSPDECRKVAPALREAIARMPDQDVPSGHRTEKDRASDLADMIEAAGKYERRFQFR